jgi:hypothetical protein
MKTERDIPNIPTEPEQLTLERRRAEIAETLRLLKTRGVTAADIAQHESFMIFQDLIPMYPRIGESRWRRLESIALPLVTRAREILTDYQCRAAEREERALDAARQLSPAVAALLGREGDAE